MKPIDLSIAIGTALLSFMGALLGVYTASRLDQSNWEARFKLDQRKTVLERRVAIMEKTASLFNKAPTVLGLRASMELDRTGAVLDLECVKLERAARTKKPRCSEKQVFDRVHLESIAKELHSLNADYGSTMTLAVIYFGNDTKAAIKAMGADPWVADPKQNQALIDAMARELDYFPK
jgi:hypothetical protein